MQYIIYAMNITKNLSKNLSEKTRTVSDGPSVSLVTKGRKVIIDGPRAVVVAAGNMVYMPAGTHYLDPDESFEDITIRFSPGQAAHMLKMLSEHFGMIIDTHEPCPECRDNKYVTYPVWSTIRALFTSYAAQARNNKSNSTIEQLKKMEFLAMLASNPKCCIQRCILNDSDPHTENFEAIIRENIFRQLSLTDLAHLTNRSPTSFKVEFRRRFHEPPHNYITRQRLAHARTLLISTTLPIADIGVECTFSNASHFIKLFGKEYGMTPAAYRKKYSN